MKRYCLALDLLNDVELINEYKKYHENVWPEIIASIKKAGINELEIYLVSNRLFMILEANDCFTFENKTKLDAENPKVEEWETLMWKYQQALPCAKKGEKWILMDQIFQLN